MAGDGLGPLWMNRFRMTEERTAYLQQEKEFYTVLASKIGDMIIGIEDLNKLGRFDLSLLWTKSMDTYLNLTNANSKYK